EWVVAGEGIATEKFDGTACLVQGGKLFKRYDAKQQPTQPAAPGQSTPKLKAPKPLPAGFVPTQDPDPVTGHWPGWVPVGDGPEDKWYRTVLADAAVLPDGTYELIGPKFQTNPHKRETHELIRHGLIFHSDAPRTYAGLRDFFAAN